MLWPRRARGPVVEIFSISFFTNNARIMIIYMYRSPSGPRIYLNS